jgi:hypothetical protein
MRVITTFYPLEVHHPGLGMSSESPQIEHFALDGGEKLSAAALLQALANSTFFCE